MLCSLWIPIRNLRPYQIHLVEHFVRSSKEHARIRHVTPLSDLNDGPPAPATGPTYQFHYLPAVTLLLRAEMDTVRSLSS